MAKKKRIASPMTTHARHDPAHLLAPGLFLSIPKGAKDEKRHIKYEFGEGKVIEFLCFSQLGVREMRVLQGLVAMGGPKGSHYHPEHTSDAGKALVRELFNVPSPPKESLDVILVRDSLRRLALEIGMSTSGPSLDLIKQSIEKLFSVTIFLQSGGRRTGTRLLSSYVSEQNTGDLNIALNPLLAAAILGRNKYAHFDQVEARILKGDSARLIHQRLSGWLDCGKSSEVSMKTLCGYVWPEDKAVSPITLRTRKKRLRGALDELSSLGWGVLEVRPDIYQITRPPINFDLVRSIGNGSA